MAAGVILDMLPVHHEFPCEPTAMPAPVLGNGRQPAELESQPVTGNAAARVGGAEAGILPSRLVLISIGFWV